MFGRVIANKGELKIKEFDTYRSHYCGLCYVLRKRGLFTSLCLNYDMTFLSILLNSLYEPNNNVRNARCICHMCHKHKETRDKYTPYVADMNILLAYYKCLDDFHDDKNVVKLCYALYLKRHTKKIRERYPEKVKNIVFYLKEISEQEKSSNIDECANLFGKLLAEVFTPEDDLWKEQLSSIGFYLGKFIYIADCLEDVDEDIKKNRPNPLINLYQEESRLKECEIVLNMIAAECAREFEKLPLIENVEILRNIIYAGIWQSEKLSGKNDGSST